MSDKYAWRVPQLSADLATYSANATKPSFQPLNGKGLSLRNLLYKSAEVSLVELAEIAPALKKNKNFTIERFSTLEMHLDDVPLCQEITKVIHCGISFARDFPGQPWPMGHSRYFYIPYERPPDHDLNVFIQIMTRPPQNVLAVLDIQIPCFRPETSALYTRSLLTNHESHEEKNDVREDFRDGNKCFNDPGRRGRWRIEEPWLWRNYKPTYQNADIKWTFISVADYTFYILSGNNLNTWMCFVLDKFRNICNFPKSKEFVFFILALYHQPDIWWWLIIKLVMRR